MASTASRLVCRPGLRCECCGAVARYYDNLDEMVPLCAACLIAESIHEEPAETQACCREQGLRPERSWHCEGCPRRLEESGG